MGTINHSETAESKPSHRQKTRQPNRIEPFLWLLLVVMTLAVYHPVREHGFVDFDDDIYVTDNPHVRTGLRMENVVWAFQTTHAANWHPLTWLSHMMDVELHGLDAGRHHLTSLFFHILNTLLLYGVLRRATGEVLPGAVVAAGFALHPLHIESVAWVAERKDVLSTFFWMAAMWAYVRYVEKPRPANYLAVLGAFALGLMAKPMVVTLPFVLVLMDFWPLDRLCTRTAAGNRRSCRNFPALLVEKIPLFLLTGASCAVTYWAQSGGGAVRSFDIYSMGTRIGNALCAYLGYMGKAIWPAGLAVLYPHPGRIPFWEAAGALLVLCGITVLAFKTAARRPYFLFGWLWFLGTLVPVIGLVQVGSQAMADRYTYIPLVGLLVALVWAVFDLGAGNRVRRAVVFALCCFGLIALSVVSSRQVRLWADSITLFTHTVRVTSGNYVILNNLGMALAEAGEGDRAIEQFREALRIKPGYIKSLNNLGLVLANRGRSAEAAGYYREALRIKPDYAQAHNNLGIALKQMGSMEEAISHYRTAIRIDPNYTEALNNFGVTLLEQGKTDEAIVYFGSALDVKPYDAEIHNHLGIAHANRGDHRRAVDHFVAALNLDPENADLHNNLGLVLFKTGRLKGAVGRYETALGIDPGHEGARNNLAAAESLLKKRSAEIRRLKERIDADPENADAHFQMGLFFKNAGQPAPAATHFQRAVDLRPRFAESLKQLAIVHAQMGAYEKSLSSMHRLIAFEPDRIDALYTIAGIHARQGRTEAAVRWLKTAVERGFDDWKLLEQDENLDNIRASAYYRNLVRGGPPKTEE